MIIPRKSSDEHGKYILCLGQRFYYTCTWNGLRKTVHFRDFNIRLPRFYIRKQLDNEYRKKLKNYVNYIGAKEEEKKTYIEQQYFSKLGQQLDLINPKKFTEKINWLKLYGCNPLITECCDKFRVKNYIRSHLGAEHVVPTLKHWESADEVKFETLPNQFVLKVNWSSGYNIFVYDKAALSNLDKKEILCQLRKWMQKESNSYYDSFSWGYKDVKPIVYAEIMLPRDFQEHEYKVFCFNGRAKFVLIEHGYSMGENKRSCVDTNGQLLPFSFGSQEKIIDYSIPINFQQMVETAEKLAQPFPFVRVDFFSNGNTYYVGEMTFYSGGGFSCVTPEEWDEKLGDMIRLS